MSNFDIIGQHRKLFLNFERHMTFVKVHASFKSIQVIFDYT
jgi:hypothetical protein